MHVVSRDRLTTIVFDLGGVLIDWDPRYLFRALFPDDEPGMERFLAEVCNGAWNHELDSGRSWDSAVADLVARHPAERHLIELYRARWPEMLGGQFDETVAILAELRDAGRRLVALTNWSAETFPIARARFEFLSWFDGIVVSGELGLAKPDPAIFRAMFALHAFEPEEAVLIDDRIENVEAARRLGMTGIGYTGAEALRADLVRLGLLRADAAQDAA
jgi:2-haloacid dehalogenase